MTDFRINVIVDPNNARRGVRDVERGLNQAGNAADSLRRKLIQAFTITSIGLAIRQLISMADTLTNLNNRLRLVTTGTKNLAAVTNELFNIANRTRGSYESTAELYARIALSSKELGVSQKELLNFTESLNQAITLSGATATESANGLIQLAQGMASGKLSGDELRSVLEQLPAVADVIAKQLGATRGALREMGKEGQITAKVILDAFKGAREELAEKFATTVPTVAQSVTVLRNKFLQILGDFDRASGITETLARAILVLADHMGTLLKVAILVSTAIGVQLARIAIPAAINAIVALGVAIAANPIGLILTAIALAIVSFTTFRSELVSMGGAFTELSDTISAFASLIGDAIGGILNLLKSLGIGITDLFPIFKLMSVSWEDVARVLTSTIEGIVNIVDFLRAAFIASYSGIISAWNGLPGAFESIAVKALNGAIAIVEKGVNSIIGLISKIPFVGEFGEVSLGRVSSLTGATSPVSGADGAAAAAGRDSPESPSVFDTQRGALTDRLNGLRAQEEAARLAAAQEQALGVAMRATGESANTSTTALNTATDAASKLKDGIKGAANGVKDAADLISDNAKFLGSALEKAFSSAADALAEFVRTGEFDFDKFVNNLLADVTRLAANQLFQKLLSGGLSGLGGGGGGVGGILSGLLGFAQGGSFEVGGRGGVDNNVLSLNGRPMAKVSKGETIDVRNGGGGGRPVQVVMNISTPNADSFQRSQEQILQRTQFALDRARRRNG